MIAALVCTLLAQSQCRSLNTRALPRQSADFWFVALGDDRPAGPGLPPTHTFKQILAEVSVIGPAFVVSSGDLVYGNEESLAQYKQEIAWIKPAIQALPFPFYNAPGNHEVNNRPELLEAYTAAFGAPYGSFDFGGFQFLQVCTEIPGPAPSIFGEQLAWLKSKLTGKPTVVFQHHPVFARLTNTEKAGSTIENASEIHELYAHGNVKLAVEGHDHIYDTQMHDGVDYRIAGGAGAPLDGQPEVGGYFHFLLVHAHGGQLEATPIPLGTLEVSVLADGVAAASNYSDTDLPVTNLLVESRFKPASVTAGYSTKKKKIQAVDARLANVQRTGDHFVTRVELTLPKHHATIVRLGT